MPAQPSTPMQQEQSNEQRDISGYRFYTSLQPDDILLGRGTGPNEHVGNIRFRCIVKDQLAEVCRLSMADCPKNIGLLKRKLAAKVLRIVKSQNGRFMKKFGKTSCVRYVEVPDEIALDKIRQSFRHQLKSNKLVLEKATKSTGSKPRKFSKDSKDLLKVFGPTHSKKQASHLLDEQATPRLVPSTPCIDSTGDLDSARCLLELGKQEPHVTVTSTRVLAKPIISRVAPLLPATLPQLQPPPPRIILDPATTLAYLSTIHPTGAIVPRSLGGSTTIGGLQASPLSLLLPGFLQNEITGLRQTSTFHPPL